MAQVTASTEIRAAPQDVWALMCDVDRYPELSAATDRMVNVPTGEIGVGYVYREYGGLPPFKSESEWRVTVFEPIRRQVHVGDDGMVRLDLSIDLLPTQAGTRLTMTIAMRPRWFIAPVNAILWPLFMRKGGQAAIDQTVANAKRLVESPPRV